MRLPLLLLALAACAPPPEPPDREGLYRQMRACLAEAAPAPPCTMVNRPEGYVVIKDDSPAKPDAWLIVPTAPVTGIEDPRALTPPVAALVGVQLIEAGDIPVSEPSDSVTTSGVVSLVSFKYIWVPPAP